MQLGSILVNDKVAALRLLLLLELYIIDICFHMPMFSIAVNPLWCQLQMLYKIVLTW